MNKLKYISIVFLPIIFTSVILLMLFYTQEFAPFGNNTLACMDANIQYLDFFAYFKDVLEGKNNISYTFGKTLGGTNAAVFSYYLSSPFNLLVLFFGRDNLHSFFDIVVLLKLALASMTCCIYLLKRFENTIISKIQYILAVILSVGYGLSQYAIAQSSNIMWLDGVYMLPLMLLAVYKIVKKDDKGYLLSLITGCSIIVNWYTAGINCIFSAVWLLLEILLNCENVIQLCTEWKIKFKYICIYIKSMIIGVLLSAVIFLPTICALKNSSRGSLLYEQLLNNSLIGKIPSFVQGLTFGAVSSQSSVALFCGNVAMIGCIGTFIAYKNDRYKKVIYIGLATFGILMFYWNPLFFVFSLLKSTTSYWFRYSYLGIFIIIFLAGIYYLGSRQKCKEFAAIPIKSAFRLGIILLLFDYFNPSVDSQKNFKTVFSCLILGIILSIIFYFVDIFKSGIKKIGICFGVGLLVICSMYEMEYNAKALMQIYRAQDVENYRQYRNETQQQLVDIAEHDSGIYRISQTSTRNTDKNGLTAYLNEGLAYNYWSISGYTSSPDDIQRNFLNRLGYRINGENFNVVNTSILGADSLLGVKYIMSKYDIAGLKKIESITTSDDKSVYENPYALPMTIIYENNGIEVMEDNPFVYQNSLYSQLLGEEVELYTSLEYEIVQMGNTQTGEALILKVNIPNENVAVYGNLPWNSEIKADMNVNDKYTMAYSCWLSPSVFYIPTDEDHTEVFINVTSAISYDLKMDEMQFYALDLNKMSEVTGKLKEKEAEDAYIENGLVTINVEAVLENQSAYVSVPYDKGWKIMRNGEKVDVELIGDCMYSIPLKVGHNNIVMKYKVPGLTMGVFLTVIGVLLLVYEAIISKNKKNREKMPLNEKM